MYTVTQLIQRLRSPDNKLVLQAVEELRAQGWLSDGTLGGVNLRYAHLQGADLFKANLEQVDLGMADLRWADLSLARLQGARLVRANLYKADFSLADLRGVDLFKANLQEARNLTDKQLARAYRLWGATMPDGSLYDGRFNLPGDGDFFEAEEAEAGEIKIPALPNTVTKAQLNRQLRSPDNRLVKQAVEALRERGWLSGTVLEWVRLRYAHLQGANLSGANLYKTDLRMADLHGANLSRANLHSTRLSKANLQGANLFEANLQEAILFRANLQGARNIEDAQLAQSSKLRGAMLPDGSRYDGRFNLPGDLGDACFLGVNAGDPTAMADFYGISVEDYLRGQEWTREFSPDTREKISRVSPEVISVSLFR